MNMSRGFFLQKLNSALGRTAPGDWIGALALIVMVFAGLSLPDTAPLQTNSQSSLEDAQ